MKTPRTALLFFAMLFSATIFWGYGQAEDESVEAAAVNYALNFAAGASQQQVQEDLDRIAAFFKEPEPPGATENRMAPVGSSSIAVDATIVLKDNSSIRIMGFVHGNNVDTYQIECTYNGAQINIPLSKIKVYRSISTGGDNNFWGSGSKAIITVKNGKDYEVSAAYPSFSRPWSSWKHYWMYLVYDEINELVVENKVQFYYRVTQLIIGAVGDVMEDPNTGEKFPPLYRYSPYTGTELIIGTHGQ